MPARRNPKKSRPSLPVPSVADLTPANLDEVAVAPVALPLPVARPAAPKAGPPAAGTARFGGGHGQPAGRTRRYAFRRS